MSYFKFIISYIVFWLCYFLVNRIYFILYFIEDISLASFSQLLKVIPNSFGLDLSFISYMLALMTVFYSISLFFNTEKFFKSLIHCFNILIIFLSSLVVAGEIAIYSEWRTKLNYKAVSHLFDFSEVLETASLNHFLVLFLSIFIALIFIFLYNFKINVLLYLKQTKNLVYNILCIIFFLLILLIGARGGVQPIPINLSDAYFSNRMILNDVAVNPNWNIVQSIIKSKRNFQGNPYKKFSDEKSKDFKLSIKQSSMTTNVLNKSNPNIIFIILESWSADNIESLGGIKGITPNFQALEKNGLLFTEFYSNGWTSDQAVSSIFSSFPVFPYLSVINHADKSRKLPCLNKSLTNYHSSFFFGGQLSYGNIKGYLLSQGFDIVKDRNNYKNLPKGRLGVHDEDMFKEFKNEIKNLPQPFFSSLFTLSSHSPYDFPAEHKLSFNSKHDAYVNSIAYTDRCLGKFMQSVKEEQWYKNTLFIIVSDHSHSSPIKRRVAQKERYKIPMLWIGEVLKEEFRGECHSKMGSQLDLTPSILSQLNMSHSDYIFGNDLFNGQNDAFIPYAFHKGYGLISKDGYYAFSETYNKIIESHPKDSVTKSHIQKEAELYFQIAFQKYLDL